jgi:DNA (cytosine-5)-methyltransferase 1
VPHEVRPVTGSHWDNPALPYPSLAQVGHGVTGGIGMSNQEIFSQRGAGLVPQPVCATGHRTHALTRSQKGATEDGTGRGTPIVPAIAFTAGNLARGAGSGPSETTVGTLLAQHGRTRTDQDPLVAIAFHPTQDPISSVEVTHALGTGSKGGCATAAVATEVTGTLSSRATAAGGLGTDFEVAGGLRPEGPMAVRRLLPVECERLQGFPDSWTDIPWRGKPAPDGPRYKSMGNSMAVPVMRLIGQRLDRVAKGDR